jgi:glycerol-3-phosphate acyltransferase PlsY
MDTGLLIAAIVAGYLIGTISSARIVARRTSPDEDITRTAFELDDGVTLEYTGVSATSMMVRQGPRAGCLVSGLDMLKAAIPVLAARILFPDTDLDLVVGAAVIAGHNWPVWHRFHGGRGVSPLYGALLVVDWTAIPVTIVASTVVGIVILADPYLSYSGAPLFLIPWFWWRFGWGPEMVFALVVNAMYWAATMPELRIWIDYRRTHPRARRDRIREFRKGFAGTLPIDRDDLRPR